MKHSPPAPPPSHASAGLGYRLILASAALLLLLLPLWTVAYPPLVDYPNHLARIHILTTIGGAKPRGICGAGLIDIVSGLLTVGIINQKGKFQNESDHRIRIGADGLEYLLAPTGETDINKDIVITEVDIDNLIRAKAAMYAGYQTLLKSVGLTFQELDKVIIAGTFGSHLDIEEAITIGLMPDIDRAKFFFIGNGSLLGARLSSFSSELIEAGKRVARMVTNIELSENSDFMNHYIAAMFLPHTDASLFPETSRRLNELSKKGGIH